MLRNMLIKILLNRETNERRKKKIRRRGFFCESSIEITKSKEKSYFRALPVPVYLSRFSGKVRLQIKAYKKK